MKVFKSTPKYKILLAYAEDDLIVAKVILNTPNVSAISALFHSHQCAKNALKAYLVYHKITFKSRDLIELINACALMNKKFLSLTVTAGKLNPYTSEILYPDGYQPELHESLAEDAITHATKILEFTKSAINIMVLTKKPQQSQIIER